MNQEQYEQQRQRRLAKAREATSSWQLLACSTCGTEVRTTDTSRPLCTACRDAEIAAMYASGRYMGD